MPLSDTILSFIKQENTDFAILINGDWGSGKTYFVKNIIAKQINQVSCTSLKKPRPYELIYVSLYGLISAEELEKKLFLEMNPILKTKAARLTSSAFSKILGVFGADIDKSDTKQLVNIFGGIPINKVIVFDDLERLSTNTINEVLGFINTYTEHQHLKVIIVADETKIEKNLGKEDYRRVKEKLIRFTYLFKPKLTDIFHDFVKHYNSSSTYPSYLNSQKDFICKIFQQGEHPNLRTLRFVLDLFLPIYRFVDAQKIADATIKEGLLKRFLLFVSSYSIEYKKGKSAKLLDELHTISESAEINRFDRRLLREAQKRWTANEKQEEKEPSEEEKFLEDFENKYITGIDQQYEYYNFLKEYIYIGDLSTSDLTNASNDYVRASLEKKEKPELIAINKLENCWTLEDHELKPLIDEILKYVEDGIYTLEKYPRIFHLLGDLISGGIKCFVNDDTAIALFKRGMDKAKSISTFKKAFRSFVAKTNMEDVNQKQIRDYAQQLNESILVNKEIANAKKLLQLLSATTMHEFIEFMKSEAVTEHALFQEQFMSSQDFFNQFSALSNRHKTDICDIFEFQYVSCTASYQPQFLNQKSFFENLLALIEQAIEKTGSNIQLSTINLIKFKRSIEMILVRIKEMENGMI